MIDRTVLFSTERQFNDFKIFVNIGTIIKDQHYFNIIYIILKANNIVILS